MEEVDKIILTASGGPFLNSTRDELKTKINCRDITIVIGGAALLPQRAVEAEKLMRSKRVTRKLFEKVAAKAAGEIKMTRDIRCPERSKRKICAGVIRGMLEGMKE